jgi:glycerol-3-phosphate dehydrogenase
VLVIGGGIVGAGVARDAAMRGLRTALVEQHDFASGTSSRSSRLLHGGIRYLAQGRIGLVWEASREKTVLARVAPHLSQPLPFIFPTRKKSGWPRWKLSIGVRLYDLLCGIKFLGRSRSLNKADTLALLPDLNQDRLTGAVRYFDALTGDARLVLDTLRSAARHGAAVCNYVRWVNGRLSQGAWRCELADARSGRTAEVTARCIVNAAGPWSDRIPNSKTSLRLTKGVHLVVDRSRLPVPEAVVLAEGARILFVIPWGERVILGTTDTDYRGPLDNPPCDPADVDYILRVVNEGFPSARLQPNDVISTWSGLRPLVADARGNPSDISRRHKIEMTHPGWWDVTGGKLTTYRLMAEETVDSINGFLGARASKCTTADEPLLEADPPSSTSSPQPPVSSLYSGILPAAVSSSAVRHYCRHEWARRLEDVMVRRTSWRYYHRDHLEIAAEVARWMAAELGWSEAELERELNAYRTLCGSPVAAPQMLVNGSLSANGKSSHLQAVEAK